MKKFLCVLVFVLGFCFSAFSQSVEVCPTIFVTGPAGVSEPGGIITFTVSTDEKDLSLEYVWTVNAGEIIEGQGTKQISMKPSEVLSVSLIATVEIKGLPEGCPTTASEAIPCLLSAPEAVLLDEFSESVFQIDRIRVEKIITAIQNAPNDQFYILMGFKETASEKTVNRRQKKFVNYFVKTGIEADRITFMAIPAEIESTQFWRVPPGAPPPRPR